MTGLNDGSPSFGLCHFTWSRFSFASCPSVTAIQVGSVTCETGSQVLTRVVTKPDAKDFPASEKAPSSIRKICFR